MRAGQTVRQGNLLAHQQRQFLVRQLRRQLSAPSIALGLSSQLLVCGQLIGSLRQLRNQLGAGCLVNAEAGAGRIAKQHGLAAVERSDQLAGARRKARFARQPELGVEDHAGRSTHRTCRGRGGADPTLHIDLRSVVPLVTVQLLPTLQQQKSRLLANTAGCFVSLEDHGIDLQLRGELHFSGAGYFQGHAAGLTAQQLEPVAHARMITADQHHAI